MNILFFKFEDVLFFIVGSLFHNIDVYNTAVENRGNNLIFKILFVNIEISKELEWYYSSS